MYNLLVTGEGGTWEKSLYSYEAERFLEYTDPRTRDRFQRLDVSTISELCSFPALFAYERRVNQPARVGSVTHIIQTSAGISFNFEINPQARSISPAELSEMERALGITNSLELNRTHWAIKDVDLMNAMELMAPLPAYIRENHVLPNANRIALKAVRAILDAAEPFEVLIEGTPIKVETQRLARGKVSGWSSMRTIFDSFFSVASGISRFTSSMDLSRLNHMLSPRVLQSGIRAV